ncbi:MAG: GNAT family N-acetyltransferase [Sedimentisphaerales bacterium]
MSEPSEVFVKRAGADDAAVVGEILGDAFGDDPVGKWISADPEYTKWCWSTLVNLFIPELEVYVTENKMGAALWVPPGVKPNIKPGLAIFWYWWRRFGFGSILRFVRLMKMMDKVHPKDDHYYLLTVGVRCDSKGQGIGSNLLESVLQKCDHEKVGAYLENSNSQNLPFYLRHGFEVRSEITVPSNGPSLWPMYREPQNF